MVRALFYHGRITDQSVERLGYRGFDSWGWNNTQCLEITLRSEGFPFALQMARPSYGSNDRVK